MLKMFGGGGSDHPMADAKEAKRLLDGLLNGDRFGCSLRPEKGDSSK